VLEKKLSELGWKFERHGSCHDVCTNGCISEFVPRHNEVKRRDCKKDYKKGGAQSALLKRRLSMEIEGRIWKEGKWWFVEISSLDVMTQSRTRKEVLLMVEDLIFEMIKSYFPGEEKGLKVTVTDGRKHTISMTTNNTKVLMALSLKRQREQSGSTVKEAAERLGSRSPNSYAQYERGMTNISIEKFEQLLIAANPSDHRRLRLI